MLSRNKTQNVKNSGHAGIWQPAITALLLFVVLSTGGCGGAPYDLAPVSGVVTLDGKPLPNAYLNFQPVFDRENPNPGPGSVGETDENGRFELKTSIKSEPGAVLGMHKIEITTQGLRERRAPVSDDATEPPELLPRRYNYDTELTFEVPAAGTDQANFDLESD